MAFWTDIYSSGEKDPKRNFRFKVQVTGLQDSSGNDIIWYAKEVTKPSFTVNVAEHAYLNHKFKFPGTVTWNDIDLTVVDPQAGGAGVGIDAAAALTALWGDSGYHPPANGTTDFNTVSKTNAVSALGSLIITQMDADGKDIETWRLTNGFCKGITYGDTIAYGNDELTTYKLSIAYDFATLDQEKWPVVGATTTP